MSFLNPRKQLYVVLMAIPVALLFIFNERIQATNSLLVEEVLSIKTGKGTHLIGKQFGGKQTYQNPYEGFAVNSQSDILIDDIVNMRIIRFSKTRKILTPLKRVSEFWPGKICIDGSDKIYVYEKSMEEVIVFSNDANARISKTFNPGLKYFENIYRSVPILFMKCKKDKIILVYGINRPVRGIIEPVYADQYDLNFNLLERREYENDVVYQRTVEEEQPIKGFIEKFEDNGGKKYCQPIVKNWDGRFLPLLGYSADGRLLYKIDGEWLTKQTRYKVFDYYNLNLPVNYWQLLKGNELLIVNWYVTPDGVIYVLLANNDYVKALKIKQP